MRRPLFGNGFPVRLLSDDGVVDVFDSNAFTPQTGAPQAIAVTLFCWAWQQYTPFATPANLPAPVVALSTNGGPGRTVATRDETNIASLQASELIGGIARPLKLLDRMVLRGDQRLRAQNFNADCSAANLMQCFIYGYFELVGELDPRFPFRPLQPTDNLLAPFSAPTVYIDVLTDDTQEYADLHLLNPKYTDLLDLDFLVSYADKGTATGQDIQAALKFPQPLSPAPEVFLLPISTAQGFPLFFQSHPFEYQPMVGPASGNTPLQAGFETSGTVDTGAAVLSAYGSFLRR